MPRIFPRPVEAAVRVLKKICDDPTAPIALKARSAELILSAYGMAAIPPEEQPRRYGLKGIIAARVKISEVDKQISERVKADRKQKKLEREIDAVLAPKGTEE